MIKLFHYNALVCVRPCPPSVIARTWAVLAASASLFAFPHSQLNKRFCLRYFLNMLSKPSTKHISSALAASSR